MPDRALRCRTMNVVEPSREWNSFWLAQAPSHHTVRVALSGVVPQGSKLLTLATLFLSGIGLFAAAESGIERDELGDKLLNAAEDPSFEAVAKIFPGMKFPREALGVKDDPVECIVLPDSGLMIANRDLPPEQQVRAHFEMAIAGQGAPAWRAFGANPETRHKQLVDGYLPMVCSTHEFDGVRYEQEAFDWSEEMNPDAPLFTFVRMQLSNAGKVSKAHSVRFLVRQGKTNRTAAEWKIPLKPGERRNCFIKLPLVGSAEVNLETTEKEFDRASKETKHFWNQLLSQGMQIQVPEQRVNEAWRAWMVYNFINVDKKNGICEPHDGSGFYEEIYGYSAGLYCHALDLMGHHRAAETYLAGLRSFIAPDGLFTLNFGLPDTGVLLWALSEHYRFTGDREWLRQAAPDLIRMSNWVINKRKESMRAQPADCAWYGLIKFRPYCDDPVPTYSYLTDTYLCVGMRAAAEVLTEVGFTEASQRIGREAQAYRADVLQSMKRAAVERGGMKMLPIYPETQKLLKDNGYTGKDYYGLVAGMLLEHNFFSPKDEPAGWLVNALEQKGGLVLGMAVFKGGMDHAYTYGYWMNALQKGEVKKVLLGLYGSLAYGMSRETYSAVEVTMLREGKNEPTLPHLYSNTQQLSLFRNMLIYEQGDDLLLCPAIPRAWLKQGSQISVTHAPTHFGETSYRIKSSGRNLVVQVDPPSRVPFHQILLKLRHPGDLPIQVAKINRGRAEIRGSDTVVIEDAKKPFTLRIGF